MTTKALEKTADLGSELVEKVVVGGDLAKLSAASGSVTTAPSAAASVLTR